MGERSESVLMTIDWPDFSNDPSSADAGRKSKRRHREPVVRALVERIASGVLECGAALSTEQEFAEEFGVSRTVIREVMQDLVGLGLIVTRPRVGARVEPRENWDRFSPIVLRALLDHGLDAAFYEPLIEARGLIEPEVAALAAARAKPSDIAEIEACFDRLAGLLSSGRVLTSAERVSADIAFHRSILACCNNWVFQRFGLLFDAAIMARMALAEQAQGEDPPFALQKHRRIVDAIKARNPGEARKAALSVLALSKPSYADYFAEGQ